MWKHKNFINLQLCGFTSGIVIVYVNGTSIELRTSNEVWADSQEHNTSLYSIIGNTVVWSDGTILQYNGVDVLPTDKIIIGGQYTTRSATPTLTFKHFFDAGTIGSGTVKFRHYSQQEPSSGETWVLNESLTDTTDGMGFSADISFTSYSNAYTAIQLLLRVGRDGVIVHYDSTEVYNSVIDDGWYDQPYRTITFSETVTDSTLLAWLQANGTKQGGGASN